MCCRMSKEKKEWLDEREGGRGWDEGGGCLGVCPWNKPTGTSQTDRVPTLKLAEPSDTSGVIVRPQRKKNSMSE